MPSLVSVLAAQVGNVTSMTRVHRVDLKKNKNTLQLKRSARHICPEVAASLRERHCNRPFFTSPLNIDFVFTINSARFHPARLLSSAPTMKTAASFWSFYSTVIAVVFFQVKQCGITRDQRNANKETNRAGKQKKKKEK